MLRGASEMRLYDIRVTFARFQGRSVAGLELADHS